MLVVIGDVGLDQVLTEHFVLGVQGDLGGGLVPLVDFAVGIDAENGGVGGFDKLAQFLGGGLGLGAVAIELGYYLAES